MTSRERVIAAINFRRPDRVPVNNYICENPLYKLGDKALKLLQEYPSDFGPPPKRVPVPGKQFIQPDGSWHREWVDEWSCRREERYYGIEGFVVEYPLSDWSRFRDYQFPPTRSCDPNDPAVEGAREATERRKEQYYALKLFLRLFERMHFLCGYQKVLLDLEDGRPELEELADRIVDWNIASIRWAAATAADGVEFSDDWGSQSALMIPPARWREFFKPRYKRMFDEVRSLGMDVWFHSDGHIIGIIPELSQVGVKVVNPQFSCHDLKKLANVTKSARVAVLADLDRQRVIPSGRPEEIKAYVKECIDTFGARDGGFVGRAEFRGDVPIQNIRAVFEAWREFGTNEDRQQ